MTTAFDCALRGVLVEPDPLSELGALPDDLLVRVLDGELSQAEATAFMLERGRGGVCPALTDRERHVMAHATAWDSRNRLYRNHYCASEEGDSWETLQALCARGLMCVGRDGIPSPKGMTVFMVMPAGIEALRGAGAKR